jgi:hypothetical protein
VAKNLRWKGLLILSVAAAAAWAIYPPQEEIRRGLDLQGGVHMVLRVQTGDALRVESETASFLVLNTPAGHEQWFRAAGEPARARTLPTGPLQDLEQVHRVVAQLKRRLATRGHEARGRRRSRVVDVRRTMRASLETGGVPLRLKYKPRRPRRPEIYVLCDVSTSVTSASVFFLSVLHALHDAFRKLRSFAFVERIDEVTEIFDREQSFRAVSERVAREAGVSDVSGYTDYGRVWLEFMARVGDDLDPRSTVIVLGDARTNGREPHASMFGRVSERAGRTFWLNPEPRLYWNYGDSVMTAYEPYCDGVFECWTTKQLEQFVNVVAGRPHLPAIESRPR